MGTCTSHSRGCSSNGRRLGDAEKELPRTLRKAVPKTYVDPKTGTRKVVEVPWGRSITQEVVDAAVQQQLRVHGKAAARFI